MHLYCTQGLCCIVPYVASFNNDKPAFSTGDHPGTHSKWPHVPLLTRKSNNACYMAACTVDNNPYCMLVGTPVRCCPVETSPARAVVGIGDPFTANCNSFSDQVEGMGWESSNGGVSLTAGVTSLPLNIVTVTDYGLEPNCYINFINGDQCSYQLPVTVYSKLPLTLSEITR